jgi:hypothetical protein
MSKVQKSFSNLPTVAESMPASTFKETHMKLLTILLFILSLMACQSQSDNEQAKTAKVEAPRTTEKNISEEPNPPTPPLYEDFQASPKLSLFPRAGSFRPEDDDKEGLPYWSTYIEHLTRTSGPLKTGAETESNIAFGFRAIKGIDSVGLFSPIAVEPGTTYEVTAVFSCDLIEEASAGIGVLEFNQFLWIGDQFSESMAKEHQTGAQQGVKLSGKVESQQQSFTFTTGPQTKMIHLVFFRDGAQDRNPVVIDDIGIRALEK